MILFLISLLLIIILHELAHFVSAKLLGCKVLEFGIGFGKTLYQKTINGTVYKINLFLVGGYNKLKDELGYSEDKDSFTNLSFIKKLTIALAGCVVNILLGILAILLSYKQYYALFYFGFLSIMLGLSNLLPIPALDGSYPFVFLLEKFFPKRKFYFVINKVFLIFFKVLLVSNLIALPYFLFKGIKMINELVEILWYLYRGVI